MKRYGAQKAPDCGDKVVVPLSSVYSVPFLVLAARAYIHTNTERDICSLC